MDIILDLIKANSYSSKNTFFKDFKSGITFELRYIQLQYFFKSFVKTFFSFFFNISIYAKHSKTTKWPISYFFKVQNSFGIFFLKPVKKFFFKYTAVAIAFIQNSLENLLFTSIAFFIILNICQYHLAIKFCLGI